VEGDVVTAGEKGTRVSVLLEHASDPENQSDPINIVDT
jgi:hypothetical protein